jgi:hypothetical protein
MPQPLPRGGGLDIAQQLMARGTSAWENPVFKL